MCHLPCFWPPLVSSCFQDKIQRMRCPRRPTHPGLSSLSASDPAVLSLPPGAMATRRYCLFPGQVLSRVPAFASSTWELCHSSRLSPLAPPPPETFCTHLPGNQQLPVLPLCCRGSRVVVHRAAPPRAELLACSRGPNKELINDQIHE